MNSVSMDPVAVPWAKNMGTMVRSVTDYPAGLEPLARSFFEP